MATIAMRNIITNLHHNLDPSLSLGYNMVAYAQPECPTKLIFNEVCPRNIFLGARNWPRILFSTSCARALPTRRGIVCLGGRIVARPISLILLGVVGWLRGCIVSHPVGWRIAASRCSHRVTFLLLSSNAPSRRALGLQATIRSPSVNTTSCYKIQERTYAWSMPESIRMMSLSAPAASLFCFSMAAKRLAFRSSTL